MTETGELSVVEAVSKVLAEIKPGSIDDNARAWRAVQAALDASEDRLRARISSLMSWSAAELGNSLIHRKIREHLGVGDDEYPWQTEVEAAQPDVVPQVLYDKGGQIMSLSMTFDNSSGYFEAAGPFFPPPQQTMRVQVDVPDGWWQALKWRLKPYWPFRWLKVRYRTYSFTGQVEPWPDLSGATVHPQGPMSKGTETR